MTIFNDEFIMDLAQTHNSNFMDGVEFAREYVTDCLEVFYGNPGVLSKSAKEGIVNRAAGFMTDAAFCVGESVDEVLAARFGAELEAKNILNAPAEVAT